MKYLNKYDIGYWLMLAVMLIAIFSCSSLRHYNKVAKDATPRSEAKRNILAPVCVAEFPNKQSIDSSIEYIYLPDTTENNQLKIIIKQLLRQLQQRPECPQIDADSLYYELKKSIKPDTIKITTKVKETLFDSAKFKILQLTTDKYLQDAQKKYDATTKELLQVQKERDTLKAGTKNNIQLGKWFLKNNWLWLLIIAGLFLGYKWLSSKFTLPFKIGK